MRKWALLCRLLEEIENDSLYIYLYNMQKDDEHHENLLHLSLLQEAGLITGFTCPSYGKRHARMSIDDCQKIRMTMEGYDFKAIMGDNDLYKEIAEMSTWGRVPLTMAYVKAAIPELMRKRVI